LATFAAIRRASSRVSSLPPLPTELLLEIDIGQGQFPLAALVASSAALAAGSAAQKRLQRPSAPPLPGSAHTRRPLPRSCLDGRRPLRNVAAILHDEAGIRFLDCPRRREAAGQHWRAPNWGAIFDSPYPCGTLDRFQRFCRQKGVCNSGNALWTQSANTESTLKNVLGGR
jgi:hypothetical protein